MKNGVSSKEVTNNKEYPSSDIQWAICEGNQFYSFSETINLLPHGYYKIIYNDTVHHWVFALHKTIQEKLLYLPDKTFDNVINDIKYFWENENKYINHNIIYKRGILLYGTPGNGKTCLIELICNNLIYKYNGIVIVFDDPYDLSVKFDYISKLRNIEPKRKIIIVFEDLDGLLKSSEEKETLIMNFLDGGNRIDNVVILATTNYPEELKERISNRPSRFDRRYEVTIPSNDVRRYYIESMLTTEELKTIDIQKWLKETEGFSLDHLKELIVSVFVLGYNYESMVLIMKEMKQNNIIKPSVKTDAINIKTGFKKQ